MGVSHRVRLAEEEEMWRGLSQSFRNQVRQGQRQGVKVVREASPRALERFYAMHAALRNAKYQSIPQPRRFFAAIHRHFLSPGRGFVLRAMAAAARPPPRAWCWSTTGRSTTSSRTSRPALLGTRATNVMLWELLLHGAAGGFAELDLGRAGLGEGYKGLRHFKEGLGARGRAIFAYTRPARVADAAEEARAAEARALVTAAARLLAATTPSAAANDEAAALLYRYFA